MRRRLTAGAVATATGLAFLLTAAPLAAAPVIHCDAPVFDFGDQPMDWGKVLQGDRFFAMLRQRLFPPAYPDDAERNAGARREDVQQRIGRGLERDPTQPGLAHSGATGEEYGALGTQPA